MAATLIFEVLCLAGIVFMTRFLIALRKDARPQSRCHVVHVTSWYPETEDASLTGAALRKSDANSPEFKVIAGGREQPFRRVG